MKVQISYSDEISKSRNESPPPLLYTSIQFLYRIRIRQPQNTT